MVPINSFLLALDGSCGNGISNVQDVHKQGSSENLSFRSN